MSLFHPRIIEKHLKVPQELPQAHGEILSAWAKSLDKGTFDRETSHDGEFIQRILIDILGYTGSSAGNQWTVGKNQPVGSGNVDVALGNFTTDSAQILAPFELKGAKTHDLDAIIPGRNKSPVQQAWEYAMDAKGAKWVLVSNYREIRLYAVGYGRKDYEKFELAQLTEPQYYARFMLLLSAESLLSGRISTLLIESENKDKEITDKLYKDYKALRARMIDTLANDNPKIPMLDVVEYTQTILDRILFVAFAEDKGLLPNDTLKSCYEDRGKWNPQPAWENFNGLFQAIDKGNPPLNIPGYNGGLFTYHEALHNLKVSDELCADFKTLGSYDYESDVSVNILGHIFEQSISDIEEIKANISGEGTSYNKKKSKRKKDGIFYTPAYITRYIVEQAVGGWLDDRKKEIGFEKLPELIEEDYASIQIITRGKRKGTVTYNKKIEKHITAWDGYKEVLSNIKVLDPACGSGAFLNEIFDYLYREGQTVNNELTTFNAGQTQLFRWDTHILSNNIYGVDINRESGEITKLSLWLKTANRSEKLTYLEDNIKFGNSLIDDPAVASEQAFKWRQEFPEILEAGGFDVIVGNPPYGAGLSSAEETWLADNYKSYEYKANTYVLFYDKGISLLKEGGILGFITPATFTYQHYFKNIRKIMHTLEIRSICKYGFAVFEDADTGDTVSVIIQKLPRKNKLTQIMVCANKNDTAAPHTIIKYDELVHKDGIYNLSSRLVLDKIYKNSTPLGECADIVVGIKPYQTGKGVPKQTEGIVKKKPFTKDSQEDNSFELCVVGANFHRYGFVEKLTMWLKYGEWLAERRPSAPFFDNEKIIIRQTADRIIAHLDDSKSVNLNNVYNIGKPRNDLNLKYILCLLNSSLLCKAYEAIAQEKGKLFPEVKKVYLEKLPIKLLSPAEQHPFIEKAEIMLARNKELYELSSKLHALMKSDLGLEKLSEKLGQWHTLEFGEFTEEIKKKKVVLPLAQKAEWMEYFYKQKAIAAKLRTDIDVTDHEINQMVYALYGLAPGENDIVEVAVQ